MKAVFVAIVALALVSIAVAAPGPVKQAAKAVGAGKVGIAGLDGIGDVVKNLGAANKEITAKVAATLGVDTAVAEAIIAAIGWSAVPALIAGAAFPLGPGLKPWPGLGLGLLPLAPVANAGTAAAVIGGGVLAAKALADAAVPVAAAGAKALGEGAAAKAKKAVV
ncbi:unnamed protein product [Acanthoscelides obtectus]|uniref:Uncharacterized protein n=1 Tax=Acanthoscelides obtectus TaxID=200917 RepID=A0A9P0Q1Y3_ACAOB|nr:unnamed protein product [Acanthoscelides obtectus]CAK1670970.1 hypothetical protein AOBTE_LOCUS27954 [Acanthoscelides obtectus]